MSDFRMDKSRPVNNNSGSMKHRDAQVIIDRTDGCKSKHYLDTDEESAKNRESKLNSHSVDGVAVSTGSKPHITRIKKDGGK